MDFFFFMKWNQSQPYKGKKLFLNVLTANECQSLYLFVCFNSFLISLSWLYVSFSLCMHHCSLNHFALFLYWSLNSYEKISSKINNNRKKIWTLTMSLVLSSLLSLWFIVFRAFRCLWQHQKSSKKKLWEMIISAIWSDFNIAILLTLLLTECLAYFLLPKPKKKTTTKQIENVVPYSEYSRKNSKALIFQKIPSPSSHLKTKFLCVH